MEVGHSTYWDSAHMSTEYPNRSNFCRNLSDRGSVYSEKHCSGSMLPPIVGGDVMPRRSERHRKSGKRDKILKPSKHGYHRHSNTPTYKLLNDVCDKLQVLVERKLSQSVPELEKHTFANGCENDEQLNELQMEKTRGTNSSSGDSGVFLDLTDYSANLSSSESVFLTPLPEDQLECVYENQPPSEIHFYLPKVSDIPEADDICPIVSIPATIKGDNSEETSHHRDLTYCGDSFMNRHMQYMKDSSTKFPKIKAKASQSKVRTKKVQLSRSKRSAKSSLVSNSVKISKQKCDSEREIDIGYETPVNVDFLNDVTTLISEAMQLSCTFSDISASDETDCGSSNENRNRDGGKTNESKKENNIPDMNCETLPNVKQSNWCYKTLKDLNKDRYVNCSTCSIVHGCGDNFASRLNLKENVNLKTTTAQ